MQLHCAAESSLIHTWLLYDCRVGAGGLGVGRRVRVGMMRRVRMGMRRVGMMRRMRMLVVRRVVMGVAEVGRRRREDVSEVGEEEQGRESDEEQLRAIHRASRREAAWLSLSFGAGTKKAESVSQIRREETSSV